jgi:hypothetical protein
MATATFDIEFTKDGAIFQPAQVDALLAGLGPVTDLLVLAHGWNNDIADASALYAELLGNADKLLDLRNHPNVPAPLTTFVDRLKGRHFAAARVFWPSKRFTDDELIPGGGAVSVEAELANTAAVKTVLDRLKEDPNRLGDRGADPAREQAIERAKALVPELATVAAQREFVSLLRSILDPSVAETDDASAGFFNLSAETLFANAEKPVSPPAFAGAGGGAGMHGSGGAAGLGDLLSGVQAAARRIANFATYYQMKSRAGTVGSKGLADVLKRVRKAKPGIRIHLVGHSFGGRLVTAAAHALPANTSSVTMCLLQAAFSHNGLSQSFEEADGTLTMGLPGTAYSFTPGKIHNILSDVITDHGDVRRIEVAYAILSAAGSLS